MTELTTVGSVSPANPDAPALLLPILGDLAAPSWSQALASCASVRFDTPSWQQRQELCEPLLQRFEREGSAPTAVWQQARRDCRTLHHEAACLPLGYLVRAAEDRPADAQLFRSSMVQLDRQVWQAAAHDACRDERSCDGVRRYLALFGQAGEHASEAHRLAR